MAEISQEAGLKVDADPFGYGVESPKVPVEGAEVPAGNDTSNIELFDVDVSKPSINETPVGEQQAESEDVSQQPARDDPSRFEYWQSQADKVKGELSQTQQELAYFREQAMQSQQQTPPMDNLMDRWFSRIHCSHPSSQINQSTTTRLMRTMTPKVLLSSTV